MHTRQGARVEVRARDALPLWLRMTVAAIVVVALTAVLALARPFFPIGDFPLPYILLAALVAYLLGDWPALVAVVLGLVAFSVCLEHSGHSGGLLPDSPHEWAAVMTYAVGSTIGALAMLVLRRRNDCVRQREELYRDLVQMIPHGVADLDTVGTIRYANPAFCRMHGYELGELTNQPVWNVMSDETVERLRELFPRLVDEQPEPCTDFSQGKTKDGRTIDVQVSWDYKRDHGGLVTGFTIIAMDITDQVRDREELRRSYERDHRIAETLQASLMRPIPCRINGFAFEKMYKAAWEEARVGGDFYDVFELGEGRIGLVIGDVSGKGLHAAVQVAAAKYSLRGRAYESTSPAEVLEQVNRTLVQDMDADSFTSIFFGIADCATKRLHYANAGHSPVILWKAAESRAFLFDPTGPVAGMDFAATFDEFTVQLEPGDEIMMGTDGLYEMRCQGSFLAIDHLIDIYSAMKREGVSSAPELLDRVLAYCGDNLRDDVAILRLSVEE